MRKGATPEQLEVLGASEDDAALGSWWKTVRTLYWGEFDVDLDDHVMGKTVFSAPNSELIVFEKSGHLLYVEEAEAFFDAVRGWLKRT